MSMADTWQQKHIMGEDSFMRDTNKWSDMAISPGGTGFNPDYMSTPPPGLFHPNFIPSHITTFDSRYMSTPPPGFEYKLYDYTSPAIDPPGMQLIDPRHYMPPIDIDVQPMHIYEPPVIIDP